MEGGGHLGWVAEDKAQALRPPTQWLALPGVETKIEAKYSENLTFLTSDAINCSVVLRSLSSNHVYQLFMHQGAIICGDEQYTFIKHTSDGYTYSIS